MLEIKPFTDYIKQNISEGVVSEDEVKHIIKSVVTTYQTFTLLNDNVHLDLFTVGDLVSKLQTEGVNIEELPLPDYKVATDTNTVSDAILARVLSDILVVISDKSHNKGQHYIFGADNFLCLTVEYKGSVPVYEFESKFVDTESKDKEFIATEHYQRIIHHINILQKDSDKVLEFIKYLKELYRKNKVLFSIISIEILDSYSNLPVKTSIREVYVEEDTLFNKKINQIFDFEQPNNLEDKEFDTIVNIANKWVKLKDKFDCKQFQ